MQLCSAAKLLGTNSFSGIQPLHSYKPYSVSKRKSFVCLCYKADTSLIKSSNAKLLSWGKCQRYSESMQRVSRFVKSCHPCLLVIHGVEGETHTYILLEIQSRLLLNAHMWTMLNIEDDNSTGVRMFVRIFCDPRGVGEKSIRIADTSVFFWIILYSFLCYNSFRVIRKQLRSMFSLNRVLFPLRWIIANCEFVCACYAMVLCRSST